MVLRFSRTLAMAKMISLASIAALGCGATAVDTDALDAEEGENAIVNVAHTDVERQSIGNCWIYAHATWVESMHLRATGTKFDSSQSYMTYWDWFHKIQDGDIGEDGVETGGSWQLANNHARRYGLVAEKDFVPQDSEAEMSSRQASALAAINTALKTGALSTSDARRNKKLIRDELNKAWGLAPEVVAYMNKAFGEDASRTFVSGSSASSRGTPIVRPQDLRVSYPSRSYTGYVSTRTTSLSSAMNAWREISYSSWDRRATQIKIQRAMHAQAPVVITWSVDFNAMEKGPTSPLKGSFNMSTLRAAGKPGRQGGHLTVLEDYQVKLPSGEVLKANTDVTDKSKLDAALDPNATIEFLQVKNSWGANRPDREFAPGMPGYHNLYMDYLNGPITWCSESEDTGTPEERGCTRSVSPARVFVVPPGFER